MNHTDLIRIAGIAKIELTDDEIARYTEDLNAIVQYASELKKIDITGVVPMVSPLVGINTPIRNDIVVNGLSQSEALKAAAQKDKGHFKVPKTVGE